MISYEPFFKTIRKKGVSQYQLITDYLIPSGTISRIKKNQNLNLRTIERLCNILDCKITDIVTFK